MQIKGEQWNVCTESKKCDKKNSKKRLVTLFEILGFIKEMLEFPNNSLRCTQPEEEEEEETPSGQEDEELNEDDLPRIQNEVDDLQQQFDASVVDKHSLAMELESMKERLKTATDIIDRLVQAKPKIHSDISCLLLFICQCISALVCQFIFAFSNHHPYPPKSYSILYLRSFFVLWCPFLSFFIIFCPVVFVFLPCAGN